MDPQKAGTKKCPFCAEEIQAAAVRCRHCQADVTTTPAIEAGTKKLTPVVQLIIGLALCAPAIWFFRDCGSASSTASDRTPAPRESPAAAPSPTAAVVRPPRGDCWADDLKRSGAVLRELVKLGAVECDTPEDGARMTANGAILNRSRECRKQATDEALRGRWETMEYAVLEVSSCGSCLLTPSLRNSHCALGLSYVKKSLGN